ncbi:hypothetical protein RRSWK_06412 [Rhodopirellula sp. SWK7]|nr:hypothetical protein RRSWK_06412 [Rhodopirellula sp. SWK7]
MRSPTRTYDLGIGIPDSLQSAVHDSLVAWIDAEPSDAPEHANRAFSNGESTARAG